MASDRHAAHVSQLMAKTAAGPGIIIKEVQGGAPPRQHTTGDVAQPVDHVVAGARGAAADAAALEPEAETQEGEAAAAREPVVEAAPGRVSERLKKSVEIERRAQAVRDKAAGDMQRSKEQQTRSDRRVKEADQRVKQAQHIGRQVASAQQKLEQESELLQTNPFEWARQRGLTGAQLADFARGDRDPHAARSNLIEQKVARALEQIKKESNERIERLENQLAGQSESEAQEALLEHVSSDGDRFEALNAIYSPEELLTKAAALAERNVKLQFGWDGDRLCEELEASARKDPRWSRIQTRYAPKPKPSTAATPKRTPASPAATDRETRGTEVEAAPERTPRAQRPTLSARDKHRLHVQRLSRTVRFG